VKPGHRLPLKVFWHILPGSTHRRTIAALSRIVTRLALEAPQLKVGQEVGHDHD